MSPSFFSQSSRALQLTALHPRRRILMTLPSASTAARLITPPRIVLDRTASVSPREAAILPTTVLVAWLMETRNRHLAAVRRPTCSVGKPAQSRMIVECQRTLKTL